MGDKFNSNKNNPISNILIGIIILLILIYSIFLFIDRDNIFFEPGNLPLVKEAFLLSENNLTKDILRGYCTPFDYENESLTCFYRLYLGEELKYSGNSSCINDSQNNIVNLSGNKLLAGNWVLSCSSYDGENYSDYVNSTPLFIDSLPETIFNYPTSLGALRQDYIILNISYQDINPDKMVVRLTNSSDEIFFSNSNLEVYANLSNLSQGVYTLNVTLNDLSGNINETIKLIYLDLEKPNLEIKHIPLSYGESLNKLVVAYDNISGIGCIKFKEASHPYFNLNCSGQITNISFIPIGFHWVNITVEDLAGNYNSGSFYVSVSAQGDVFSPIISNLTKNVSLNSAIISWNTNEVSDSRIFYGTNKTNLVSTFYSSTRVSSHSIRLENLANNTIYYFNITNCDSSGNCISEISNFTTFVSSNPQQKENEEEITSYSVSSSSLNTGYERTLISGDYFSISRTSGERYNLTVVSISSNSVRLKINNLASFIINSNSNKILDTDSNNINDLEVSVLNIVENKAKIRLKAVGVEPEDRIVSTTNLTRSNQETPQKGDEENKEDNSIKYIIIGLIIVFILAITIIFYIKKKEIINYFSSKRSNQSSVYPRIWSLIHQLEELVRQGKKEQAKSVYNVIRNLYPSLKNSEKASLKPKLLRLFSLLR